jgi:hypothetical protein
VRRVAISNPASARCNGRVGATPSTVPYRTDGEEGSILESSDRRRLLGSVICSWRSVKLFSSAPKPKSDCGLPTRVEVQHLESIPIIPQGLKFLTMLGVLRDKVIRPLLAKIHQPRACLGTQAGYTLISTTMPCFTNLVWRQCFCEPHEHTKTVGLSWIC